MEDGGMSEKRSMTPIIPILCCAMTMTLGLTIFLLPRTATANPQQNDEAILSEIILATVKLMCRNGYEMPDYRVVNGHTDVPISGPPEKYAFFGHPENEWIERKRIIVLDFYEAHKIPLSGRTQLIDYLMNLHEERHGGFALHLYMTSAKYKKPQVFKPEPFFEMKLNRIVN